MYYAEVAQTDFVFREKLKTDPANENKINDWLSQCRLSELLIVKYYKILTKKNNSFS